MHNTLSLSFFGRIVKDEVFVKRWRSCSFTSGSLTNKGGRNVVLAWQEIDLAAGTLAGSLFLALLEEIKKLAQSDDDPGFGFSRGYSAVNVLEDHKQGNHERCTLSA